MSSGKSTLSKKLVNQFKFNRVSGDAFRHFISDNIAYFANLDISFPNDRTKLIQPLLHDYRLGISNILLDQGEHVMFDGTSMYAEVRTSRFKEVKKLYPKVTTVLIFVDTPEELILSRLKERDTLSEQSNWVEHYHKLKKPQFEVPTSNEADAVLTYYQYNYQEIEDKLQELLAS